MNWPTELPLLLLLLLLLLQFLSWQRHLRGHTTASTAARVRIISVMHVRITCVMHLRIISVVHVRTTSFVHVCITCVVHVRITPYRLVHAPRVAFLHENWEPIVGCAAEHLSTLK